MQSIPWNRKLIKIENNYKEEFGLVPCDNPQAQFWYDEDAEEFLKLLKIEK